MEKIVKKEHSKLYMGLLAVGFTIILTVYGQMIVKWQVNQAGELPNSLIDKVTFIARQYLNPWVISALAAAFLASASWITAMTQLELSFAYPFMSLAFVLVLILSVMFFGESLTLSKLLGTGIIIVGLIIVSQS